MNYFSWANWWSSLIFNMLICPIWSLDSKIKLTNGINLFFACWYNFKKINLKVLGVGMGVTSHVMGLWNWLSEKWTDGINWFFACWYSFTEIECWSKIFWMGIVKNGCGQSGHGTQKLAFSSILVFACWYKFRKAKSWFNDFGVGLVKYGSCLLVYEILKSAVS